MKRNMKLYLQDIVDSMLAIEQYTQKISEKDFYSDLQVQDAVIRRLEIIGEAVKNLDDDFKTKHHEIEWKQIAGMRDIIAHEYFGVKLERVWDVVKQDIPVLKQKILKVLEGNNN